MEQAKKKQKLDIHQELKRPKRVINLSAGCAALPLEVLEKAQKQFIEPDFMQGQSLAVSEMGYRTSNFHKVMDDAEASFRSLMGVPDDYEVHFFNGGATLQFAAIPMNLCPNQKDVATYIMNGHWSEKARNEAKIYCDVKEANIDPKGLYFTLPDVSEWKIDPKSKYIHFTLADTRQGFEFQDFPFDKLPQGIPVVCDASASLGSRPVDISKFDVVYAAAHKNFSTSGVCYTIIKKNLITSNVHRFTPTMCNWKKFQDSPNKIYNVPVIFSIWFGWLVTEWMKEKGGLKYFEDLRNKRANVLYDYIDKESKGFYRTFVNEDKYRSRMNIVFTIRDGEGKNGELVTKFLNEATEDGWLDIKSHPLGISSNAIRVTTYNAQPIEVVEYVRDFMRKFQQENE